MLSDPYLSYFAGKRILITGASGYLATNLVNSLVDVSCAIIRLSRNEKLAPIDGEFTISDINGDICGSEVWELALSKKPDIIYHFSGQTSVYRADENPFADLGNNVSPMLRLLESCRNLDYKPIVVFAGTSTEAGIPTAMPCQVTLVSKDYWNRFVDSASVSPQRVS